MARARVRLQDGREAIVELGATKTIQQPPQIQAEKTASPLERAMLSFGDAQGREKFIQERGITQVNKPGFDLGDITSKAGGALPMLAGILGSIPGGMAGSVVPGAGTVVGAGLTAAPAAAAGEGLRQAIGQGLGVRQNVGTEESLKDVGLEALLAGVAPGVGKATTGAAKYMLGGTAGKQLQKAFRPLSKTIQDYAKYHKGNLLEDWANLGIRGTIKQVQRQASSIVNMSEKQADRMIAQYDTEIPYTKVVSSVKNMVSGSIQSAKQAGNTVKAGQIEKATKKILSGLKSKSSSTGGILLSELQKTKRVLQKEVGQKFGTEAGVSRAQSLSQKALKEIIESVIPQIAGVNKKTAAAQALVNTLNRREAMAALGMTDRITSLGVEYLSAALGASLGYSTGSKTAAAIGAPLGFTAGGLFSRTFASPLVRTTKAQAIKGISNLPSVAKTALGSLLTRYVGK